MKRNKKILLIFNSNPYDGTDVTWNGLRLAGQLLEEQAQVKIFLMNDSVDLARASIKPPEGYFDLGEILKELIDKGVEVGGCGSCVARCGINKNEGYFSGVTQLKMSDLANWTLSSDLVLNL
ncbi:MAG: sulfur reduction protein DsrE [Elusimicrobia bacterium]|nr:sulfur reduction protein DsrE [Elusimicrobiota bacterium]